MSELYRYIELSGWILLAAGVYKTVGIGAVVILIGLFLITAAVANGRKQ